MKGLLKNLGLILILVGAVILVACSFTGNVDSSGDPDKVIINGTTYTDINEFTYW